ncbi:MAG: hypothetical protein JXA99_03535 [Candidatus Lokiarchaeota archaeon]|nr:hypothetical protein [Candidatus Lokiarchaeota archaeon]
MSIISREEFLKGIKEYEIQEPRDTVYKITLFYIQNNWDNIEEMVDALNVFLRSWNRAFYRYGKSDFKCLESIIRKNYNILKSYRDKSILSFNSKDYSIIKKLFNELLEVLKIENKNGIKKSPVSVSKALHLLAPNYFPLWDQSIAIEYHCYYSKNPDEKYINFCKKIKEIAENISYEIETKKSLVKLIDQYNYAKYTKKWI